MTALRVALDASPLREERDGMGRYVEQLLLHLPRVGVEVLALSNRPGEAARWMRSAAGLRADAQFGSMNERAKAAARSAALDPRSTRTRVDRRDHRAAAPDAEAHDLRSVIPPLRRSGVTLRPTVLWQTAVLHRQARRAGANLLHYTTGRGPIRRRTGIPIVITVHDLEALLAAERQPRRDRLLVGPALRAGIRAADGIIAVSESTAADLRSVFPAVAERIRVVPEASALTEREDERDGRPPWPRIDGLRMDARYWLHVGTITTRKNLPRLVEAYADFLASIEADAGGGGGERGRSRSGGRGRGRVDAEVECDAGPDLVLAGKRGAEGRRLAALARSLGIEDRVHLPGFVPEAELRALYSHAEACIAPSLHEGFGLSALEALSMGLPLLCARSGALREIDPEAALFVDPRRIEDMVSGMRSLNADAGLRRQLAASGRRYAERFSWLRSAEMTREVYAEVSG